MIAIRGTINVKPENDNRNSILKNNAPFTNCISKTNNVLMENVENLDLVTSMYSLI